MNLTATSSYLYPKSCRRWLSSWLSADPDRGNSSSSYRIWM